MGLVATDYGIKEALKQLGILELNEGSSTGSEFFSSWRPDCLLFSG